MFFVLFFSWSFAQTPSCFSDQSYFHSVMGLTHFYPRIIWTYWDDESTISVDVQEMIDVTRRSLMDSFTIIFVTNKNLSNYLNISAFPPFFSQLRTHHKADYIRLCLMEKYGGVYVDASTYVTSGSEMEWFFAEAIKADAELWGFSFIDCTEENLIPNFFGGAQYSPLLSTFKKDFDDLLSRNFYQHCKNVFDVEDNYFCYDAFHGKFFTKSRSSSILFLPGERSHYRLARECSSDALCIFNRLLKDSAARKYPFIKLTHDVRTGVKLNL